MAKKSTTAKTKPRKKAVGRSTATVPVTLSEFEDSPSLNFSDIDLLFVHYVKTQKGYEIFVAPHLIKLFFEEYKIELAYDEETRMFTGKLSQLPRDTQIMFIEYKNSHISPAVLQNAKAMRNALAEIDERMEALKQEHMGLRKKAIDLVMNHGISTKKGRVAHKKILTGEWITSVRQLIPDIEMKIPNVEDVKELMKNYPQYRKQLQKLADSQTQCYEIQTDEEKLLETVRTIVRHKVTDLKISFKSCDDIDESKFDDCFSWEDMDLDVEKAERIIESLPFEVKLDMYNLPELDETSLQFHYKTDQKTDPDCPYCGGDFGKNTHKCKDCGLTALKSIRKK